MLTIYTSSFSNITLCLFCITLCLFRSSVTKTKRCQFCMNLITIKNLSRHELKCEQRSFLGGSLQQDHEESFAVVDQPDPNIENTSLEESDESDVINEGTAEGSDNDFNIKSDPEDGDMGASDKILILFCIFVSYRQMTYGISDRATAALLTFIKQFVHVLSKDSNNIEAISLKMPKTLYSLNKIIGNKDQPFTEFVACSMRYKLLKFSESWQKLQGVNISKKCNNKLYPDHTKSQNRAIVMRNFWNLLRTHQEKLSRYLSKSTVMFHSLTQSKLFCLGKDLKRNPNYGDNGMYQRAQCVMFMMDKFGQILMVQINLISLQN